MLMPLGRTAVSRLPAPLAELEAIIGDIADLPARDGLVMFANRAALLLPEKRRVIRLLVRELRGHQPRVPIHMLVSSLLILLLLDQPLESHVAQLVDTLLNGIHATE